MVDMVVDVAERTMGDTEDLQGALHPIEEAVIILQGVRLMVVVVGQEENGLGLYLIPRMLAQGGAMVAVEHPPNCFVICGYGKTLI